MNYLSISITIYIWVYFFLYFFHILLLFYIFHKVFGNFMCIIILPFSTISGWK
ncbi:hypothetical protein BLAHAN_04353 [Blautia hansenii DSM 20583]|uniref:Uncharacterized protein n=1 Tax=Blautia hansenii DSM 20583 TaxID=537007 RepID=C9L4Q6_BLAHA|nr:hypothetical protein BLAHAN_04353 [Blautia hansenii DSM 20583]